MDIHRVLLLMMKDIDRVCRENDINYFLTYGTLIGAVRHKGFIPWDDDVDIAMLREDYEKFMNIANSKFKLDMYVENVHTSARYGHFIGKVFLNGTEYSENFTSTATCSKKLYIDVFPIDRTTCNAFLRKIQDLKSKVIKRMFLLNRNYNYQKTGVKKVIYKIGYKVASYIPRDFLVSEWEKNASKYANVEKGFLVSLADTNDHTDWIPESQFKGYEDALFEDCMFSIPRSYDSILKKCYGEYMRLPPEDKRYGHHNIIKIDLGSY